MSVNFKNRKGFTLIELLIVIAILGTLAVVVLIALNPVQQLARTRDAGRISTVTQMGHSMEALGTTRGGVYPASGGTGTCNLGATSGAAWITNCLVGAGEIPAVPANPAYSASAFGGCGAAAAEGNWCYNGTATGGSIFTTPESTANQKLCANAAHTAYFVFSTTAGRGGVWFGAAIPGPNLTGADSGWVN